MSIELPDAPVIVTGTLLSTKPVPVYDEGKKTGEYSGAKSIIMVAGDDEVGFANIKLTDDDLKVLDLKPNSTVSWYVVNRPWKQNNGSSGMATGFLREVNGGDLDRLGSLLAQAKKAA